MRIRHGSFILSCLLILASPGIASGEGSGTLLQWYGDQGEPGFSLAAPPTGSADGPTVPLMARPWFESAAGVSIEILGGEPFRIGEHPDQVVLLNFWASWCGPCRKELPQLQRLLDRESATGLTIIAVNVDEPDAVAREMADELGLTLPVGRYNQRLAEILNSRKLPSTLLLDGAGQIRKRWGGYRDGLVELIRREVFELRAGDQGGFPTMLGAGTEQSDRFRVRWSRDLDRPVAGVALLATRQGEPVVAVTTGRELVTLRKDGRIIGRVDAPDGMSSLLAADYSGDGVPDLLGFRRGSRTVGRYDFIAKEGRSWTAPEGIFSLVVQPGDGPAPELLAGSVKEARRLQPDGTVIGADPDSPAAGAWMLVTAAGMPGIGVGTDQVTAAATGSFTGPDQAEIALATRDGLLLIQGMPSGKTGYRASWAGITGLAGGDLDGDGVQELLVASGSRITVMGRVISE